jgi:hypothetical protein
VTAHKTESQRKRWRRENDELLVALIAGEVVYKVPTREIVDSKRRAQGKYDTRTSAIQLRNSGTHQKPSTNAMSASASRRTKDLFGDCALVEIIHLHDCFRGALAALKVDVDELCLEISDSQPPSLTEMDGGKPEGADGKPKKKAEGGTEGLIDLERRVAGRFTVIWSVFRAHSAAEDEFIWPALKAKQVSLPEAHSPPRDEMLNVQVQQVVQVQPVGEAEEIVQQQQQQRERAASITVHHIEQEEYEEDHADEERMFNSINSILSTLRAELVKGRNNNNNNNDASLQNAAQSLLDGTKELMKHLLTHLDKEETHCMPLVAQYLTKSEINDLVGKIMGKRSSELMSQILTMAVQNLNPSDRDDMVRYMKQAMVGTFFERWLKMGGWIEGSLNSVEDGDGGGKVKRQKTNNDAAAVGKAEDSKPQGECKPSKNQTTGVAAAALAASQSRETTEEPTCSCCCNNPNALATYTTSAELEKLIRAIGTNPNLDTKQKNLTIQGLRDSVWKSNCRVSKRKREDGDGGEGDSVQVQAYQPAAVAASASASARSEVNNQSANRTHHLR